MTRPTRALAATIPALLAVILAAVAVPAATAAVSSDPAPRTPIHLWWSPLSTAATVLSRAPEFGVTGLILEHDTGDVPWGTILDGLCDYDFSERWRRDEAGREAVDTLRRRYREITAAARAAGVDTYLLCPEIDLPAGFGPVNLDDPELWVVIGGRLREVFRALPDLSGYMLYVAEGDQEIDLLPGSEHSASARVGRLIETCRDACRDERRRLLVTTFARDRQMLDAIASALRSIPPDSDLAVVQYCCPGDWGLYALVNPSLGRVGPHPEILGFDACGENWGQGSHPFVQSEWMASRLREARGRGANIAGLACAVGWEGRTALGTLNEANLYAARELLRSPERDGRSILREWCAHRFGEKGADLAAACLARTDTVVFAAQHLLGYWADTDTKSGLPTLAEMDRYLVRDAYGSALTRWDPDPELRRTWEAIRSPDEAFLSRALAEKEESIRLCRESLHEIRGNRALFEPSDYATLERAFTFQELWAKVWRDRVEAYLLLRMTRRAGGPAGGSAALKGRLEEALTRELANADSLERRYGAEMFPPGPAREREYVASIRERMP
jgi:hypothetical protein